jgi:hypothetical protein
MGCGRIVTAQDIQQIREARKGMEAGSVVAATGNVGLGLKMIITSSIKLQKVVGDIGERITQQSLKGHNLNTTVGHNSKVYDVGNQNRVASVKTYGIGHGSVSKATVNNYVRDLRVATGRSQRPKDVQKFNAAAQELRQAARQGNVALPSALQNAPNDKAASDWLRRNAEMRIPDDHVKQVRNSVRSSVIRNPETYGLSANASYADRAALAQQLARKVQPMGMSVANIEQIVEKHL